MNFLTKLSITIIVLIFLLFLYLNNGSITTSYYQFDSASAFDCSDDVQNEIYFFVPRDISSLSGQYSYVFKRTKNHKAIDIGAYETRVVLGRHLVGNFWQKPEPYFISPIFSTRYYSESTKPIRLDYKLVDKVGYGITQSSFSDIGETNYIKATLSDSALQINGTICPKIEVDYSLLNNMQKQFGHL